MASFLMIFSGPYCKFFFKCSYLYSFTASDNVAAGNIDCGAIRGCTVGVVVVDTGIM